MKNLIILFLVCLTTLYASAQKKPNVIRTATNTYSVGTYAHPFVFERVAPHQGQGNDLHWDWAACIEMILNYDGLNVAQDQVVSLVNGSPDDPLSAPQDLIFAVNKTTPHAWGKPAKVVTSAATLSADVLFDELSAGRPLIMASGSPSMEGRAFVITAMSYNINYDAEGNQTGITPYSVTLRDPWPSALATRTLYWKDFGSFLASLYTINVTFDDKITK